MKTKFDKNIPPPHRPHPWRRWAFDAMAVGDSLFVKMDDARNLRSAISLHSKGHPDFRYITKTVTEKGVPGIRAWRTP